MTKLASIICLFIFAGLITAQDDTRVAATWQVVKYDIVGTLPQTENDRTLTSKAKLDLRNVSARPASTVTLRINTAAQIVGVTVGGTAVDFTKSEEKVGTGAVQRIVVRIPAVQPGGTVAATVDYKITVKDNSGVSSISTVGSQFLPLSFWYPTPNSWFFARGADYAPFRVQVNSSGSTVVSSGTESGGGFDLKFTGQPFFVAGNWDVVNASGLSVFVPKGAGPDEQKFASELAAFA